MIPNECPRLGKAISAFNLAHSELGHFMCTHIGDIKLGQFKSMHGCDIKLDQFKRSIFETYIKLENETTEHGG